MTIVATSAPVAAPESSQSAISWGAILAGAAAASAASLCLFVLGSGLGFAAVSPWSNAGVAAGTFAVSAAIWLVIVQWLASALGGYVTGRLRTRWVGVHTDEVFFRDTAHGFLAWCVSTLIAALLVGSAVVGTVSTGVQATTSVLSGAAQGASQGAAQAAGNISDPSGYLVDTLFRPVSDQLPPTTPATNQGDVRTEAGRIVATSIANGEMTDADKAYLAQLIAARTGIPAADAEKRVNDMLAQVEAAKTKAKEAADAARKAATTTMLLGFVALLIGAFIAAVSAALAGKLRDEDVPSTT
ncbi:hypothetical protein SAMN02745157_1645 [Kaistia soli DSM 19436]|uniref:Transmembrane protein n=1 Tax=Kaistia soli DSM 19436 TaxID=1122133 RepID=A0A1M4YX66_9HYPH|nr:hypothetical protein [Kaistia soli]SHF10147.1 hypothetical protein SAMN02745157_1645 [Kaistia soli DSM 19436]